MGDRVRAGKKKRPALARVGRPPEGEVARENVVGLRLTDEELAAWQADAAADGRTLSNWIRSVVELARGRGRR